MRERKDRKARLDLTDFGLTEADLDTAFETGKELGIGAAPAPRDCGLRSRKSTTGTIGFEYMYIRDPEMLDWFQRESGEGVPRASTRACE